MHVESFTTEEGLYAKTYASLATDSVVTLFSEAGVMQISSDETSVFTPSASVSGHMMATSRDKKHSLTVGKWKIKRTRIG